MTCHLSRAAAGPPRGTDSRHIPYCIHAMCACYHTHIHLFNVDTYLKDLTDDRLRKLIQRKIGRTIRKLNKEYNKSYKGVDVKVWEEHRHANYNFKDYEKYRGHQDEDLVLDLHNSDFLS